MTAATAGAMMIIGCVVELAALFSKRFYWRPTWDGAGREAPLWADRLLCGVTGILFILAGLRYFLLGY